MVELVGGMRTVSFSLALLAVLAVVFVLYWGMAFFIPMLASSWRSIQDATVGWTADNRAVRLQGRLV